ncbi:hypothetical protein LTR37_019463 [Vermiconidia calcicola]|uniref:Uncharacterized protein n=1 Tax=Vermiconidia calcicola TaxID=1690605 RepID=A0ACC3ME70_9PEZI|nr:hypothetical protein LTR37_019463 [Vermiconidia calcicola]
MDTNKSVLVSGDVERQLDANALDSDIVRLVPRDSTEPFEVHRCQLLNSSDYFVKAIEWKKLRQEVGDATLYFPEHDNEVLEFFVFWLSWDRLTLYESDYHFYDPRLLLRAWTLADQYMVSKLQQALLLPIWLSLLETPPSCELIKEVFDKTGDDSKVSELLVLAVLHECLEGGVWGPKTPRPNKDVPAEYNTAVNRLWSLWCRHDKGDRSVADLHLLVEEELLSDVRSRVSAKMFGDIEMMRRKMDAQWPSLDEIMLTMYGRPRTRRKPSQRRKDECTRCASHGIFQKPQ